MNKPVTGGRMSFGMTSPRVRQAGATEWKGSETA